MKQLRALLCCLAGLLLPLLLFPQNCPAAAGEADRIINLWNGLPPVDQRTGSAVVVCPGGGFNILAWDLEGTEVAEWLNSIGVTAVVLKYRVPTSRLENKWLAPVQDAQRCVSLVRAHAADWDVAPDRIGLLGFSAGGSTAVRAALAADRMNDASDDVDQHSCQVNAAIVIYPAYLANDARTQLRDDVKVSSHSPPMFLVHAADDPVTPASSLHLALALQEQGVAVELHLFDTGGHGYGLRPVEEFPVTRWNDACTRWLQRNGWAR